MYLDGKTRGKRHLLLARPGTTIKKRHELITRWGSCNFDQKQIRLNLELAKKPDSCLDYIIVHEMVHLMERHHYDAFVAHMDRFLPHWRQLKVELNQLPVRHWGY